MEPPRSLLSSPLAKWPLAAAMAAVAVFSLWFLSRRYSLEPYMLVLGLLAAAVAVVATRKFTAALLAGILYVGNFKTTAAVGISPTDPTFIVLMLCSAGLLVECLLIFSGKEDWTLFSLFKGQGRGVFLYVLFVLLIALSGLYTPAPETGLIKLEHIAVFNTVAFFGPLILFKKEKDMRQFLLTCVVLSLALSLRNLLELFHPSASVLAGQTDITRIGDAELIGTAIVVLIYYRLLRDQSRLQWVCIAVLAIGLAASAARSAALSLVIALIVSSVILRSRSGVRSQKKILLGALVGVIVIATFMWIRDLPAARMKLERKEDELDQLLHGAFLEGGTAEQRMTFYKQSLDAISQKPILGWGVSAWGVYFLGIDKKAIPHDFILEAAVEQGLLGCGVLLGLLFTTWSTLRRTVRRSGPHFVFLVPAFLLSLFTGLVTGSLEGRLLWFWCGTIFAISRMVQLQLQQDRARQGAQQY
ncbi:MAG TPA: O-antigen ligase family protein [Candidatus Angelobacter sp.]|nr:O-antigen ligase family protein [Candidatus Angelobacter sp.]